jgi:hypothetical protein
MEMKLMSITQVRRKERHKGSDKTRYQTREQLVSKSDEYLGCLLMGLVLFPIVIVVGIIYVIVEFPNEIAAFISGIAKRIWNFHRFVTGNLARIYLAK